MTFHFRIYFSMKILSITGEMVKHSLTRRFTNSIVPHSKNISSIKTPARALSTYKLTDAQVSEAAFDLPDGDYLKVGDVITVEGKITNYRSIIEFDSRSRLKFKYCIKPVR